MNEENKNVNVPEGKQEIPKNMKKCKTCGQLIAKSAKVCPSCGAKQKGKAGLIVGGIIVLFVIIGIANSGGDKNSKTAPPKSESTATTSSSSVSAASEEQIEYTDVSMLDLTKALDANAMNAEDTYEGNYFRVTGVLNNIDSDGKYISIGNGVEDF